MNNSPEKRVRSLLKSHATPSLSSEEKTRMRLRLEAVLEEKPVLAPSRNFFGMKWASMAMVAVLVFSGYGVSSAQSALPGDLLYGVKLFTHEEIPKLFMSDEERSEQLVHQIEWRLEEATELKEGGKLNRENAKLLQSKVEQYQSKLAEGVLNDDLEIKLKEVVDSQAKFFSGTLELEESTVPIDKAIEVLEAKDGLNLLPVVDAAPWAVDVEVEAVVEEAEEATETESEIPDVPDVDLPIEGVEVVIPEELEVFEETVEIDEVLEVAPEFLESMDLLRN